MVAVHNFSKKTALANKLLEKLEEMARYIK